MSLFATVEGLALLAWEALHKPLFAKAPSKVTSAPRKPSAVPRKIPSGNPPYRVTARNSRFLHQIRRTFAPAIYWRCCELASQEGEESARDYLVWHIIYKLPL